MTNATVGTELFAEMHSPVLGQAVIAQVRVCQNTTDEAQFMQEDYFLYELIHMYEALFGELPQYIVDVLEEDR